MFGDLVSGRGHERVHATADRRITSPEIFGSYFDANLKPAWLPRSVLAERVGELVEHLRAGELDRFSTRLQEMMVDEAWATDPVLRADLPVAFTQLSHEQLAQLATAALTLSHSTEPIAWTVLWDSVLNALTSQMTRDLNLREIQLLVHPVRTWIELSPSLTEAYTRFKQAHSSFRHFELATDSLAQSWLHLWEDYLLSDRNPFVDYSPRWAVHLVVLAGQLERSQGRNVDSTLQLYEWVLEKPDLLPVIFSQLKDITSSSSQVEVILGNLVGGPAALAQLVKLATDLGVEDNSGALATLSRWRTKAEQSDEQGDTKEHSQGDDFGEPLF